MALRWCNVVIDCRDAAAQATWWASVLGWEKVYEDDDEVALAPAHAAEHPQASLPLEQMPPELVFVPVPEGKKVKNRLHIDLAPHTTDDRDAEIARLIERGATLVDLGQSADVTWTVLADPEGNEFCVLSARDA